ncbi:hypothetical protein TNCV_3916261 [Trichonephila clavipes]|nr:hypothetical protein TNCV_3916261 [Trichonephila clavipes]
MILSSVVQLISDRMLLYQSTFISSQSLDSIKFNKSSKTSTDESSLKLELKPYQTPDCDLPCDISTGVPRPFVPASFRRALFNHLHNLSHPGIQQNSSALATCGLAVNSKWPEAIPIPYIQAKTICRAIFDTWISRFGCPSVITSDQGTQMRSSMYAEFTRMLGTAKIKTTAYHPKSNGIVERFHRHLKSAIKAHENDTWSEIVPIILLGIRAAVKEDLQSSCAEIMYGTNLRLPSNMIDVSNIPFGDNNFITNLCNRMQQLNPVATSSHCIDQYYIHPSLQSSSHIFLRIDRVQPPLRQSHTGPHKVLSRTDKTITIDVNGRRTSFFLDRVKPAHLLSETVCESLPTVNKSINDDKLSTNGKPIFTTKLGRHLHFLKKQAIYVT